jgi:hypothetical protein
MNNTLKRGFGVLGLFFLADCLGNSLGGDDARPDVVGVDVAYDPEDADGKEAEKLDRREILVRPDEEIRQFHNV